MVRAVGQNCVDDIKNVLFLKENKQFKKQNFSALLYFSVFTRDVATAHPLH